MGFVRDTLEKVTMLEDKSIVSAEIPSIDISERPCYYGGIGRIKGPIFVSLKQQK